MAEENRDRLHIRLHLYDTDLSVTIPITDTVNTYSSLFKGKRTDKDILYMALLDIALRYEKESSRNDTAPYSVILNKLTSEIEEALKS